MYIEQLGKVDINAMYKITTQKRLLENLVNEYEKFADPRLVPISLLSWLTLLSLRVRGRRVN